MKHRHSFASRTKDEIGYLQNCMLIRSHFMTSRGGGLEENREYIYYRVRNVCRASNQLRSAGEWEIFSLLVSMEIESVSNAECTVLSTQININWQPFYCDPSLVRQHDSGE